MREFLYQYTKRADGVCGPEFKERKVSCDACEAKGENCTKSRTASRQGRSRTR